jgi:hypothetical protein
VNPWLLRIAVHLPEKLSGEERKLYEELRELYEPLRERGSKEGWNPR